MRLRATPKALLVGPLTTMAGERGELLFHLDIDNRSASPLTLRELRIDGYQRGTRLSRRLLDAALLAQRLRPLGWIRIQDRLSLAAAQRARGRFRHALGHTRIAAGSAVSLLSLRFLRSSDQLPDELRLRVLTSEGPTTTLRIPIQRYRQVTALRLPLTGRWLVLSGYRPFEPHASLHLSSQRFAYDLVRRGPGGLTYQGDRRRNGSYFAYDQPVLAAADGVVVGVNDGVADNDPVGRRPAWHSLLRRPRDLAGNFVVLRHRRGEHSAYFHLRPGLRVKLGQKLRAGAELGRCGNSGNSLEPHLHFQLQQGPDPLHARGLPARFGDFSWHYGHVPLYVPAGIGRPLPRRLLLEVGRAQGAVDAGSLLGLTKATP